MSKDKPKWVHQPELWELQTDLYRYTVYYSGNNPQEPWLAMALPKDITKFRIKKLGPFYSKKGAMLACRHHQQLLKNSKKAIASFLKMEQTREQS